MSKIEELGKKIEELNNQISALTKEQNELLREREPLMIKEAKKNVGRCFKNNYDGTFCRIVKEPSRRWDDYCRSYFSEKQYYAVILGNIDINVDDAEEDFVPFYNDFMNIDVLTDAREWKEISDIDFKEAVREQVTKINAFLFGREG